MNPSKFKNKSIMRRILFPMCFLVLLQIGVLVIAISCTNILPQLSQNEIDILQERVINRSTYLENEMNSRWSNVSLTVNAINQAAEEIAGESTINFLRLEQDSSVFIPFLKNVTDDLISMLRSNGTTGVFLILNQQELSEDSISHKQGVYIRDSDPLSASSFKNEDLIMERAPWQIAQSTEISTSVDWKPNFEFIKSNKNYSFFVEPYKAALNYPELSYSDLGYWSEPYYLDGGDSSHKCIAYSVPLILQDGTVYGVLGVEISLDYLRKQLPYNEISNKISNAYILCTTQNKELLFRNVFINGPAYKLFIKEENYTSLEPSKYNFGYKINVSTFRSKKYMGCINYIKPYNSNTPFSSQKWVLMAVIQTSNLFTFSNKLIGALFIAFSFVVLISGVISYIISYRVARPIAQLSHDIKTSNPNHPTSLTMTNINEVDDLAIAIEALSRNVYDSASKFTQIMEMASIKIAGFDINLEAGSLFITEHFFEIFGLNHVDISYIHLFEFKDYMEQLREYIIDDNMEEGYHVVVYHIVNTELELWIQLKCIEYENRWIGLAEDITKQTLELKKIQHERDYDILTDLINRRAFSRIMDNLFEQPESLKISALIMLDLDNLKYINDTYGHDYGDEYIKCAAKSLKDATPSQTLVARMSGDEFFVFFYGYDTKEEIRVLINEMKSYFFSVELLLLDQRTYRLKASGGIAWYPDDSTDFKQLLQFADFAMYKVKNSSKGELNDFDLGSYNRESYLLQSEEELDLLLEHQAVTYHFQPIISAENGQIFAYEALMRSNMKTLKSPLEIITLAKKEFKLNQIERLTWFKAMECFVNHIKEKHIRTDCKVFINSIPNQILSNKDTVLFEELYHDYLHCIVQEITEEEKINPDIQKRKLIHIKNWHGELALDDYGSGYNSETSLLNLSPKYVKIDISIIQNIDTDINKQKIVENLISYAHERNIILIGEGVETYAEAKKVIEMGVDLLQGYYFKKPSDVTFSIPIEKINEILEINQNITDNKVNT